jgi:hypothetical protein
MKFLFKSKKAGPGRLFTEQELLEAAKEKPVENLDIKMKAGKKFKLQDRMCIRGLDIAIENKKGTTRKGVNDDGTEWSTYMHYSYGYIRKTESPSDNEYVDCYIGDDEKSDNVYVVNQNNPTTGKFDEQKIMIRFTDEESAKKAYLQQYDDPKFFGSIKEMPFDEFKKKVLATADKPGVIKSFSNMFKAFGKQLKLFGTNQIELFTGEEKDGKKLMPSGKNPQVRRWQGKKEQVGNEEKTSPQS